MKQLWTEDRVSFAGTHFQINDIPGGGKTLQKPYPPIYIAANQDRGVSRAAKQGDGWLVSSRSTITTIAHQTELYKRTAEESSKSPYISAWREMFVAETREKAIDIVRPHVEWLYKDRAASGHSNELPEADRIDVGFDQVLKDRFIIGNPDDCIREIHRYKNLGIQELILRCQWPGMSNEESLQAVNIFGREVIPAFN